MIHYLVPAERAFSVVNYLALDRPALAERFRVLPYEELATQAHFNRGTYVLAGLDQVTPAMARLVSSLHEQLAPTDGVRVLNHPARSLGRFDLLTKLHQLNRNEFRVMRANGDLHKLRYPVFLRGERSHGGSLSPLLHSPREVERAIGRALVAGHSFSDLVAIEFCSTADSDGLFRKYSAWKVGDRVLARCVNHGRDWSLKLDNSEFTRPLVLEERDYVFRNPHAEQLAEIFEIAAIEFGLIDYALKDGRIQTWEINVNPTFGRGAGPVGFEPTELRPIRGETREFFFDRLREAWDAIDLPSDAQAPVLVVFDAPVVAAAVSQRFPSGRIRQLLRAILRPVKPLLEPLAPPLLGILAIAWRSFRRR